MRINRFVSVFLGMFLCAITLPLAAQTTYTESVLYNFTGQNNGDNNPYAGLVQGSDGNLYGTTESGTNENGAPFQITTSGSYTYLGGSYGLYGGFSYPYAGLVEGSDGNFYGTTSSAGSNSHTSCGSYGCGTIFKITPSGTVTTLYNFCSIYTTRCTDGSTPYGGLVLGSDGNFYGTTYKGGSGGTGFGAGTVYKITPAGVLTTLHNFTGGSDGGNPYASLVQGSDGNFYSTTYDGGSSNAGTIFQITASGSLTTLHSFAYGSDGSFPWGALVEGGDGNFYGTSSGISKNSSGRLSGNNESVIFKISPQSPYTLTTLYTFTDGQVINGGSESSGAYAGLFLGSDGNFYGTTFYGGTASDGSVFQITPAGAYALLYSFTGDPDGANPYYAGLVQGSDGNFYGTTSSGGNESGKLGTVFGITVSPALAPPVQLSLSSNSIAVGSSATLNWNVTNAFSTTLQQCYAFVQNNATGAGTWTGLQTGTSGSDGYSGSATITPTAEGIYTYTLTCGGQESGFATLTVGKPTLAITTSSLANGTVGTAYSQTLTASNGIAPYTWSITSGALPAGLSLATGTGIISGSPAQGGTGNFVVQVKDSSSTPMTATASLAITVVYPPITVAATGLQNGTVGTPYSLGLSASGGLPPYAWSITSGALPAGLTLAASTGVISGIPMAAGASGFTVQVADSQSPPATGSASFTITIAPAPLVPVVTASVNPSTITEGQSPTLTATLSGSGATAPTGTVQFLSNGANIGPPVTVSAGTATLSNQTFFTQTGVYSITASYSGDTVYTAATSGPASLTVNQSNFTLSTVYNFSNDNVEQRNAPLIQAADGNFYGMTSGGGNLNDCSYLTEAVGCGTIFKLTPSGTSTTLYSFTGNADGGIPAAGLTQGSDGNFYGTTGEGGNLPAPNSEAQGAGTIFKLTPAGVLTTLYSFCASNEVSSDGKTCLDGEYALTTLLQGSDGNFYGSTEAGGDPTCNCGVIFKITPSGVYTVLHSFIGSDGQGVSVGSLMQGSDGNFYGTSGSGGANGWGSVFKFTSTGTFTTLYSPTSPNDPAENPNDLLEGPGGNFYGINSLGTVFQLTPSGSLTTVYAPANPYTGNNLVLGSDGNFYGTSFNANSNLGARGMVFEVTPSGVFTDIYGFTGTPNGGDPGSDLMQASDGSFYSTVPVYGSNPGPRASDNNDGFVYKLTASPALPAPVQLTLSSSSTDIGTPVTLTWTVVNAFSTTMQQCYAFVQNNATGAGTWTGLQTGTFSNNNYSGSATVTPTASGTYTYALTCGGKESGFATLSVAYPALTVTTSSLPSGTVLAPYSEPLEASGGTAPYTWSVSSGTLPAGLSLNAGTGVISGTPTAAGTFALTVQVADSASKPATASASLSLTIAALIPQVTASLNPATISAGQSTTLTANLFGSGPTAPTGTVQFQSNGSNIGSPVTVSGGTATLANQVFSTAGIYAVTANYSGDSLYAPETSAVAASLTVNPAPTVAASPSTVTISTPGGTGTTTLTVSNFSNNSITFACSGLPVGAACSFGALSTMGTSVLQITTSAATARLELPSGRSSSQTMLALLLPGVIGIGGLFASRKRRWRQMFVLLLLLSIGMAMTACGGSSSGGGGNHGSPVGTSTVTVTATAGTQTATVPVTLTIQ